MRGNCRLGLTLLETVISMGLLAILILGLLSFFTKYMGANAKEDDLTAGVVFAQMALDRAVLNGTYASTSSSQSQAIYTHDSASQTTFLYSVTSTSVPLPAPSTKNAYYVEVQVSWWSQTSGQVRSGVGNLETRLGRLVTPP